MIQFQTAVLPLAAFAVALVASPIAGQGKGNKGEHPRGHAQQQDNRGQGKAKKQSNQAKQSQVKKSQPKQSTQARASTGKQTSQAQSRAKRESSPVVTRRESGSTRVSWNADRYQRTTRRHKDVPVGWCQGVGNPHNTIANCGWGANRYDTRDGVYRDRDGVYRSGDRRYSSYEQAHQEFHAYHDRRCSGLSGILRAGECRAEHDRWHDRYDPNRDLSLVRVRLPL